MLAEKWWFWALALLILAGAGLSRRRFARFAYRLRRAALARGLVELPAGQTLSPTARSGDDLSLIGLLAGAWVVLGPWIWGYHQASGAIATDAITGGAVILVSICGIVFPAFWALNLLAGLWLVIAPWLVGYGDANGPVGLSDSCSGILVSAVAIAALSAAQRAVRPGSGTRAVGRIPPRDNERRP
jgi:hypothetical protein